METKTAPETSNALVQVPFVRTVAEVKKQREMIVDLMKQAMVDGVDFGKIPGCGDKPTLFKPGSEKILSMFRIGVDPMVEDLSNAEHVRFRVKLRLFSMNDGTEIGMGIGEASSEEEKYCWRAAVCAEEFTKAEQEGRARIKWKKGSKGGAAYSVTQVRTNPADVANTVLKMSKKRAQIDAVLTSTAASDIFGQDIEDLPPEVAAEVTENLDAEPSQQTLPGVRPKMDAAPSAPARSAPAASGPIISDAQARRFYAIWKGGPREEEQVRHYLREVCGVDDSRKMPLKMYDAACKWAEGND